MELKEIISITGRPGLFKVVAQGKNNVIVESIVDKKRFPAYATDRISTLGDISIYTTDEDVKLTDVLASFHDHYDGKACPSHKEELTVLEGLLEKILPNYDKERVYKSDLRKIFQWYNILIKAGIKIKEIAEKTEESNSDNEEKTVKKVAPKKAAPKKAAPKSKGGKPSSAKKSGPTKTGSQRGK
tara:strand:+ start:1152 stop:1706 length:555 start_codon:yes stop_codon:yes gene_type:complete